MQTTDGVYTNLGLLLSDQSVHTVKLAVFEGLEKEVFRDRRDYPEEALREALLNALVHRDYAFSGSTLINVFDDRIEFVSVGGLPKGISLDDILLGLSVLIIALYCSRVVSAPARPKNPPVSLWNIGTKALSRSPQSVFIKSEL